MAYAARTGRKKRAGGAGMGGAGGGYAPSEGAVEAGAERLEPQSLVSRLL